MKRIAICSCVLGLILLLSLNASAQNVRGDVNQDGQVNISDVTALIDYLLRGSWGDDEPKYVDLGLPSGTQWATCNVGADSPEGFGDYFAWGEVAPKVYYNWSNYKWGFYDEEEEKHKLTKYSCNDYYGSIDNKRELDYEDDAAFVLWGESWRMPTSIQCKELIDECSWQTTNQNGVSGLLFEGPNGNTLFFPAAGFRMDSLLYVADTSCSYWSCSLGSYSNQAYCLTLRNYGNSLKLLCMGLDRSVGHNIRPVIAFIKGDVDKDGQVNISDVTALIDYLLRGSWGDEQVTPEEPEYVDLGLPSGTLWATTNLPGYFAWGETSPKNVYNWYYYKWCTGESKSFTKYCTNREYGYNGFVDYKTELDLEDDAAYVNWGPSWRIPTLSQWKELYQRCTWEWTGSGQLVTGPNGNMLYLPASGFYEHELCLGTEEIGEYWTNSLHDVDGECYWAYSWSFVKGDVNLYSNGSPRCDGLKVRAVYVP